MIKKLILAVAVVGLACSLKAQEIPRYLVWPAGPPGTYNNPAVFHGNIGEVVTMSDLLFGGQSTWYKVRDWGFNTPTPPVEQLIFDDNGQVHHGPTYSHWVTEADYFHPPEDPSMFIYMVKNSNPPFDEVFMRIVKRLPSDPIGGQTLSNP